MPLQQVHERPTQIEANAGLPTGVYVPFESVGEYPHRSHVVTLDGHIPGLNFNGYVLEPSAKPVPEELIRVQTGTSIAEPGSIFDEESGRTYYNHNTGKYFFPNDPVRVL